MISETAFKRGLKKFNGKNQHFHQIENLMMPYTDGVKYVVDSLELPALLFFIKSVLDSPEFHVLRLQHGCKTLLVLDVNEQGCNLSLYIGDSRVATMLIDDRPDLPYVHVAMIIGRDSVYLLNEE